MKKGGDSAEQDWSGGGVVETLVDSYFGPSMEQLGYIY